MMLMRLLLIVACATISSRGWSAVTWAATEQTVFPHLGDAQASAHFALTNDGPGPVTISEIATSCGCTGATATEDPFAAKEARDLLVTFTFGARHGPQMQTITVTIADVDGRETQHILHLTVDVPDPKRVLSISRQVLSWDKGTAAVTKELLFTVNQETDIAITAVEITDEHFHVAASTVTQGRSYRIEVTPGSTAATRSATLTIITNSPMERFRRIPIILAISELAAIIPGKE